MENGKGIMKMENGNLKYDGEYYNEKGNLIYDGD